MGYRRQHHLSAEVFDGRRHVVSLTICTSNRKQWAATPSLAEIVREGIENLHRKFPIIGYCIMPDHTHLLLCNAGTPLGEIVRSFKGRTSRRVREKKPGSEVWQAGYWDHVVRKDDGLFSTLLYIFLNPVRAGMVKQWWDYQWLGSPLLGNVGEELFSNLSPEHVVWRDLIGGPPNGARPDPPKTMPPKL